jgi:hypothetical protein
LNNIFTNLIDDCFKHDQMGIFHYAVKDKDAPDYSRRVQKPMDLTTMRGKARRSEYHTAAQIVTDFE